VNTTARPQQINVQAVRATVAARRCSAGDLRLQPSRGICHLTEALPAAGLVASRRRPDRRPRSHATERAATHKLILEGMGSFEASARLIGSAHTLLLHPMPNQERFVEVSAGAAGGAHQPSARRRRPARARLEPAWGGDASIPTRCGDFPRVFETEPKHTSEPRGSHLHLSRDHPHDGTNRRRLAGNRTS